MKYFFTLFILILTLSASADDSEKALQQAIQSIFSQDTELLSNLLTSGAVQANAQDTNKNSLLHLAVSIGNRETIRILLAHQADPLVQNSYGQTALDLARQLGDSAIISELENNVQKETSSDGAIQPASIESLISMSPPPPLASNDIQKGSQNIKEELWEALENKNYTQMVHLLDADGSAFINVLRNPSGTLTLFQTAIDTYLASFSPWYHLGMRIGGADDFELSLVVQRAEQLLKIIALLIYYGADLNYQDEFG